MYDHLPKAEIEFNAKAKLRRKKNILSDLYEIDDSSILPSSTFQTSKEKKKEEKVKAKESKKNDSYEMTEDDEWMATLTSFKSPKTKKKKKTTFDEFLGGKKKKKGDKEKKKGGPVNHKKDFDPEMILLRNLQMDQNKFVESLQKKYDQMEGTKSTARGVGKFTTDLIMSITSARSLSMQLVDKIISTKKTIADLDFKERKEFGSQNNSEQANLNNSASTYLKQMLLAGRNNIVNSGTSYGDLNEDTDIDDLFDSIQDSLENDDSPKRSKDAEMYLLHENDDIKIKVIWHDSVHDGDLDEQYDFVALDKDGDIVPDYPLPTKTKMNINRSTGMCTDSMGIKYEMIIVD